MTTWTKDAVEILIDAYKNEPCLYQIKSPNYHNKNLHHESLKRICAMVCTIRPNTTEKECSIKFYNLRNQFNSENAKVRASIKSGIGSENVYKPNLWYYNNLKFVEENIVPRKSKTSLLPNTKKNTPVHLSQHDYSQDPDEPQELEDSQELLNVNEVRFDDDSIYMHEENFNSNDEETLLHMSSPNNTITAVQPTSGQTNLQLRLPLTNLSNINKPSTSGSCSSLSSTQSSSDICDMLQSPAIVRNPKKRKLNKPKDEDVYVKAIESIAESLKIPSPTPVNVMKDIADPVDACMSFLGSLLKKIQSRDKQLDVMNNLVQTVMNASLTDS